MKICLPPIVRSTVDLLNGPQIIEVEARGDGRLVAMVPGFSEFIWTRPGDRLRIEISGLQPVNAIADIATYRVIPEGDLQTSTNDKPPPGTPQNS
jgi:hypothetical protein